MGRVVPLTLLAIALAPLHATPQHTTSLLKKPAATAATHPASATHRPGTHTPNRTSVHVVTVSRSTRAAATHAASTHGVRSRLARAGRTPRTAPAPTYQLHPDPERYQVIQKALAERGYFKGEPNGAWGDDSGDAMRRFQADQKIDNDGKVDALSLIALGLGPKHDGSTAAAPRVTPIAESTISSPSPLQPATIPAFISAQPR